MLLVATPNLCVDRTQTIADLVPGAVMRALEVEVSAGGKGVNIARVVRAHGRRATLVGLVADNDRAHLLGLLKGEGADVVDVPIPGDVRMAMIMIERPGGRTTVLNEPGSTISTQSWQHYRDAVEHALPGHTVLACSGSLPPGAPVDAYGQLVELAHRAGIPALVDSAPAALRGSLASRPDLVTPNLQEAEAAISGGSGSVLADADTDVRERATAAALTLCELGARAAAVTAGAAGVALADADSRQVRWVPTVQVDVISAVGAGDSFLAGVLLAVDSGAPGTAVDWAEAVLRGAATATASCEQLRAGGVDPSRVEELLVQIRELAVDDSAMRSGA
ncbi:MAG: 1-phosphofructokinase [Pseudonocardiales bacterium]|jgi:1-phosphofructokinase family hexose kinase|nr:1-phosphofructokinase/tagatose 6-phosphate kinase [Pseudonocardiales bacterium]MDT4961971.1 1-phosphofructokinase [Pseudonocardiales bacterium]